MITSASARGDEAGADARAVRREDLAAGVAEQRHPLVGEAIVGAAQRDGRRAAEARRAHPRVRGDEVIEDVLARGVAERGQRAGEHADGAQVMGDVDV